MQQPKICLFHPTWNKNQPQSSYNQLRQPNPSNTLMWFCTVKKPPQRNDDDDDECHLIAATTNPHSTYSWYTVPFRRWYSLKIWFAWAKTKIEFYNCITSAVVFAVMVCFSQTVADLLFRCAVPDFATVNSNQSLVLRICYIISLSVDL